MKLFILLEDIYTKRYINISYIYVDYENENADNNLCEESSVYDQIKDLIYSYLKSHQDLNLNRYKIIIHHDLPITTTIMNLYLKFLTYLVNKTVRDPLIRKSYQRLF